MKKVININFQGTVIPIEESAYEILREYIDSLRRHFNEEEGRDEIINDIEGRISELFQIRLKDGAICITDEDVLRIMDNIGRPKDFDDAINDSLSEEGESSSSHSTYSKSGQTFTGKRLYRDNQDRILGGVCSGIGVFLGINPWIVRILFILSGLGFIAYIIMWIFLPSGDTLNTNSYRKFYRNPDDRIIGGVCGGIGSYFSINPWIPRILFLIPLISVFFQFGGRWLFFPGFASINFLPGAAIIYIILWAVIPEARTTSEKLQMKGERVDLNSIKESVTREMKDVGERMEKFGRQAGDYMKEKSPYVRDEFSKTVHSSGGVLGRIIVTLVKIFVYILLGSIAFALFVAMFALGIAAVSVFPLKDFIIANNTQNILAWMTLIFFIGVPVVGTIVYLIRQLSGRRSQNNYLRNISIGLWIFGWICLFSLISLVGREFKYVSSVNQQNVELSDPGVDYLEVKPIQVPNYRVQNLFGFDPYGSLGIRNDTALLPNVRLRIVKSADTLFSVAYFKMSNGYSAQKADENAEKIKFRALQQDSILYLSNLIPINKDDNFRNQQVEVAIAVPINHRIKIDRRFYSRGGSSFYLYRRGINSYFSEDQPYRTYHFSSGREYIMKADGLHKVETLEADGNNSEQTYRFNGTDNFDSLKKEQRKEIEAMEKSVDSARNAHKKQLDKLQDSLKKQKEKIDEKLESLHAGYWSESLKTYLIISWCRIMLS